MQVKRFVADDMRTAMRIVKEEIGPDAVILSNRVVDGQVEILAARDYDEALMNNAINRTLVERKPDSAAAHYERLAAKREIEDRASRDNTAELNISDEQAYLVKNTANSFADVVTENKKALTKKIAKEKNTVPAAQHEAALDLLKQAQQQIQHQASGLYQQKETAQVDHGIVQMRDELKSLRAMLENQQVLGEWSDLVSKHPLRVTLYKRLTAMGFSQEVCKYLAKGLDSQLDIEHALQAALKQLVHQLPIADDDILNRGGVYAMVGPTGVGKTTTVAKLAARFAMQHGQRHVALISTDTYRIGAHEQLMTYGRLLGVPVHAANDTQELQKLLHKLHDKKLVLIDTAGMSQRDLGLSQQFAHLSHPASMIKPYLVLSANAQLSTLDEVITAFKKANLAGCILTKLDEAASLGGVLSAVIKHHLPTAYVSNGQKVPEDIQPARARDLVKQAVSHSKYNKLPVDDEFMAAAFSSAMPGMSL